MRSRRGSLAILCIDPMMSTAKAVTMAGTYICQTCRRMCYPKTTTRGDILVEFVLWWMMILPGLIYSIWRWISRYKGCGYCGGASLVPVAQSGKRMALEGKRPGSLAPIVPDVGNGPD
jgi:hypothetical protein